MFKLGKFPIYLHKNGMRKPTFDISDRLKIVRLCANRGIREHGLFHCDELFVKTGGQTKGVKYSEQ